ncbi:MAG: beta-ketoacyl-[acyl-carrier-protein] synthase family protein, partial [Thermoguttaceae bacterium]|nr:beta-ketoacyl-[acyl-carrier-protein] synthase family protein [Thermoguttaceae bacterium]
ALANARLRPSDVDIVNTHATATVLGDIQEMEAIKKVFASSDKTYINNTKSFIGHAMGAAGALELAGNLPSFTDGVIHPTINVDQLDPKCAIDRLVMNRPLAGQDVRVILINSFGMVGINAVVIVAKYEK